jgi:hypothetical protein
MDEVCRGLQVSARGERSAGGALARRIIGLARGGEKDSARLRDSVCTKPMEGRQI